MSQSDAPNASSLFGLVIMTIGCILGIIGVATTEWEIASASTVYRFTKYEDRTYRPEAECRVGLWEHCCTEVNDQNCVILPRDVNDWQQGIRIALTACLGFLVVGIVLELAYLFKRSWRNSYGWRQCVSFVYSLSVLGVLFLTLSFTLKEYTDPQGYFNAAQAPDEPIRTNFSWSFYLTLVGALLNPIGVFLICTGLHSDDDAQLMFKGDNHKGLGFD